jgi:soluble P-type ATPase
MKKKIRLEELHVFVIVEEERALGAEERMKKAEIVSELGRSTLMEEVSWR